MADKLLAETKYLQFLDRDGWTFVRRGNSLGVVAIVAVTPNQELILVEQYRPPLQARVLELPAGLAGDIAGQEQEPLETAAERELLEETGYACHKMTALVRGPSSAGLTNEMITIFLAEGLERQHAGGGDEHEDIRVHHVPIASIGPWLEARQQEGLLCDYKIFAGLYFWNLMHPHASQ